MSDELQFSMQKLQILQTHYDRVDADICTCATIEATYNRGQF